MKHILFGDDTADLQVALLIKTNALNKNKLDRYYVDPTTKSIPKHQFVAFDLFYNDVGKAPAKLAKEYLNTLLHEIDELGINTLLVCDAAYFKYLTKERKAEPHYGYILPCKIDKYEHLSVILAPNYQATLYNPLLQEKVDRALDTLMQHITQSYQKPGMNIIHSASYPDTVVGITQALQSLHAYPELTCDIEAMSLEFWNAGISSIAFAWDKHNGVAFGVDRDTKDTTGNSNENLPSFRSAEDRWDIYQELREFFLTYKGKLTYHNIGYDAKVLVYNLFMDNFQDYPGMIHGIKVMTKNFDDTKLIAYLATNNTVKNELGLKALSAEYTGNYAEDVKNTKLVPLPALREYNLKDCLATWYVKEKYSPVMDADMQRPIYDNLMKPTTITLMQTELCGMPINMDRVKLAKRVLQDIVNSCSAFFENSQLIKTFHMGELLINAQAMTAKAKKKVYTIDDPIVQFDFNPNSNTQLTRLIYDYLGYPVLDTTSSKQPSTSGKALKKLALQAKCPEHIEMFNQLQKLADANIILNTFIPAFENAQRMPDGSYVLFGNFNNTGTQSLRLSSSSPNLMNLPSSSTFAKIIKDCFETIKGWLFVGSDFDSLEDRINSLVTKDPMKLRVYTEGLDGHCLRAYYYWPQLMPDIDPNSVVSINSIKKQYGNLRQISKAPTFALTYQGTHVTLMNNCGFSEEEAKRIENNYHDLYQVSDEWTAEVIEEAKKTGYIEMVFGARIRTPLLAKTVGKGRSVPYAAKAEARSGGNAKTQSYCALTLRAFNEFLARVWDSPYRYQILPSATIHDAIYLRVVNNAKVLHWVNTNLIECMAWQDLPEIQHPTIRITSAVEVFWPSWRDATELKNYATKEEIKTACWTAGVTARNLVHYNTNTYVSTPSAIYLETKCGRYLNTTTTLTRQITKHEAQVTCPECQKKLKKKP